MTATISRSVLSGDELLEFVTTHATTLSNSEMCKRLGYPSQQAFVDALTAARLFRGEYTDAHGTPTHDVDLLEHLESILCISQSEVIDIAVTLRDDYGINDLQDFQDVYAYHSEEYNWESEFAEHWVIDVLERDVNFPVVVDWQATWDCNLRYDFSTIEYSDGTIILHNN